MRGRLTSASGVADQAPHVWEERGFSTRLEVGLSGAKVAFGYSHYSTEGLSGTSYQLALLGTCDCVLEPLGTPADIWAVGPEASVSMLAFTLTGGVARVVSGATDTDWIVSWSVGMGF